MVRHAQWRVAHAAARRHFHFSVLQVHPRVLEIAKRAGVVIVEMRDDHVFDLASVNAQELQAFARQPVNLTATIRRDFMIEAGVDHICPLRIRGDPDEIVEILAEIMRIPANKVLTHGPVRHRAVFDRVEFIECRSWLNRS